MNTQQQMEDLQSKFDLHAVPPEEAQYSFQAADLTDTDKMSLFVETYAPLMKALDNKAVAAYFSGWFASVCLASLYSVAVYRQAPDLSLSNLSIHLMPSGGYCRVAFSLNDWTMNAEPPEPEARNSWYHDIFTCLFRDTAGPIFRCAAKVCGLRIEEAWGQLPGKINYYLEIMAGSGPDSMELLRMQELHSFLLNELPAEVFGLPRNPLQARIRRVESLQDSSQTLPVRSSCCMYYLTEGGSYCFTCPRLKEAEREIRRREFRCQEAHSKE